MENSLIPVYKPWLEGNEKLYVNECLDSNWISSKGKFINEFENEFAKYIKIRKASSVCNGTVALHLALKVLEIGDGDEVIVPTFTYIATINAIKMVGAKPVFVDSLSGTWNIDFNDIIKKITPKTKAVMVVHLYGLPCEMDQIGKICKDHKLYLIEDAAEAFGSFYKSKHVGTFGDISTFSFFGNKTITTGEGGMIVSDNLELIDKINHIKSQAVSPNKEYWHDELGYNYRMTNLSAAIGLAQLEQANSILEKKKNIAELYKICLKDSNVKFQDEPNNLINSYWMVSILFENKDIRDKIRIELLNKNVETRPFFYPAHVMPTFKTKSSFPIAENISSRGINLPSFPSLSENEIIYISKIIKSNL